MHPSSAKAYPDFGGSTSEKTSRAERVSSLSSLRKVIADCMVRVHQIPPDLAEYHVSLMDEEEVLRRFKLYAEMELSVIEPNPRAGNAASSQLLAPRDLDGQIDGTQPHSRVVVGGEGGKLPGKERNATGSDGGGEVCPRSGISGRDRRAPGEGF